MKQTLHEILRELYEIDPGLAEHEESLITLISELMKHKPDTRVDASFARELKDRLFTHTTPMKKTLISGPNKWLVMLGGAVAIVVLLPVAILFTTTQQSSQQASGLMISRLASRAFGELALVPVSEGARMELSQRELSILDSTTSSVTYPFSGGGGVPGVVDDAKMIIPPMPYIITEFSYDGDISLEDIDPTVYKRAKNMPTPRAVAQALQQNALGLVDARNFGAVTSFILTDGQQEGYTLYVDYRDASASISLDWANWVFDETNQVTLENFPSDDRIIGVAQDFARRYGINISLYGAPVVDRSWQKGIEPLIVRDEYMYVPQEVSVRYPLLLNGIPVYEQWGGEYGITINVNVQQMKATGAYNLIVPSFEASEYALVQDIQKVRDTLKRGGNTYIYYIDSNATVETIAVADPEVILMQYSTWDTAGSDMLFVPALRFEVTGTPKNPEVYAPRHVIVPLIQDVYDRAGNDIVFPVEPMPFPIGGVEIDTPGDTQAGTSLIRATYEGKIVYTIDADKGAATKDCSERNGVINTCGSSCAPDAEICTMECALVCEF